LKDPTSNYMNKSSYFRHPDRRTVTILTITPITGYQGRKLHHIHSDPTRTNPSCKWSQKETPHTLVNH